MSALEQMTSPPVSHARPESLATAVLAHLDIQIASLEHLYEIVLKQGVAIRARDVHTVVQLAGLLHGEISRREHIERERTALLERAGAQLGIPAEHVTVTRLATLMDEATARTVVARSAQLRGLLDELRREHSCNRAIMQIELSFLDHLMQALALDGQARAYDTRGSSQPSPASRHSALHVLDLKA